MLESISEQTTSYLPIHSVIHWINAFTMWYYGIVLYV